MMPRDRHIGHTLAYSAAHHSHRCCIGPANGFVIRSPLRHPPATRLETSHDQVRVPAVNPLSTLDSEQGWPGLMLAGSRQCANLASCIAAVGGSHLSQSWTSRLASPRFPAAGQVAGEPLPVQAGGQELRWVDDPGPERLK